MELNLSLYLPYVISAIDYCVGTLLDYQVKNPNSLQEQMFPIFLFARCFFSEADLLPHQISPDRPLKTLAKVSSSEHLPLVEFELIG